MTLLDNFMVKFFEKFHIKFLKMFLAKVSGGISGEFPGVFAKPKSNTSARNHRSIRLKNHGVEVCGVQLYLLTCWFSAAICFIEKSA